MRWQTKRQLLNRHPRITGLLNSNSYIIVVLILTIFSLAVMAVQFLLPDGYTSLGVGEPLQQPHLYLFSD